MDHNRVVTIFGVAFCWIVLVGSACCDATFKELTHTNVIQDEGNSTIATNSSGLHLDIDAWHVTADFILRLNELIKSLATFALDGSLDTRTALNMAQDEWNRTERILTDLVETTQGSNATSVTLRESLDTIRLEKIKLISLQSVLDRRISTVEMDESNAVLEELPLSHILHPSIAGLTEVSADLLRSLDPTGGKQFRHQPRTTSVTKPSVEEFNTGFIRKIRETKRILVAEAKQMLQRTKARLSVLPDSEELKTYVHSISNTIKTFLHDIIVHLHDASTRLNDVMLQAAMTVDHHLSDGLSQLFKKATNVGHFNFLELCLTRYVYKYYDQSQATAKLLYCVQPELATLEYLVTVSGVILERAVITDSSAVKMAVICSRGSTSCMEELPSTL
ncbi:hypothetical protein ZHAS_00014392 [Anopheles sinensis]|uniref:Secreted protein n=1 Tax=Anopheles sinensis TaxID=74873 RepID=A0A084W852_ANOSI|nr:hypothetical protein ZHAS_00014392 [Anopheles sinensis]